MPDEHHPDKPFWLVWNPAGRPPLYRHESQLAATSEAERLARANPGQTFVVLESVCSRRIDAMLRQDLRPGSDIPF